MDESVTLPQLRISKNRRFLVTENGDPFFYLADTGWEMFHRLDRAEIEHYLRDRVERGFNVVQSVILAENDGLTVENREGQLPLHDLDPAHPNEDYFELVDHGVRAARDLGLYVALVPTWGAHVEDKPHVLFENLHVFTPDNARTYGRFLGQRYGRFGNVIWINGGDRLPDGHREVWEQMRLGIREGDPYGLMTFHPPGGHSSRELWPDADWIDFDIIQSGHYRFSPRNWEHIAKLWNSAPVRPILDGEPNYEDLPVAFYAANPRFLDMDVRKAAYWSVFAGSCGHSYGHNSIWQMYRPGETPPILAPTVSWREALKAPGASQLRHLRALIESRPYTSRIPDQTLIEEIGTDTEHVQITRDGAPNTNNATYLMVYLPILRGLTIRTDVIGASRLRCWWFNPRTGAATFLGEIENQDELKWPWEWRRLPGSDGPDWVIVIDDAAADYGPPGGAKWRPVNA